MGKDGDKLDFVAEYPIMSLKFIPLPDTEQFQNLMSVTTGQQSHFRLCCDSPYDRNEWVN
jgi:hypothetical protein